ncbi:MAG: hypothetical protein J6P83_00880 [Bacteroidales bacterium]|nr:hypothetical protein [Bacteroidales bacterium]
MKTKLSTILSIFLVFAMLSCNKDNNNNGNNNTENEIIKYEGKYPAPENIVYEEDGITYSIKAIPGQVVIISDVDHNTVINAVTTNEGKIIEQIPQLGYYLIEIASGIEKDFITAMKDSNITAEFNFVEYQKEKYNHYDYYVFDNYSDVSQHGKHISEILSTCQSNSIIKEINLSNPYAFGDEGIPVSTILYHLETTLASENQALVNLSYGYGEDEVWDAMSADERESFIDGWKNNIILYLDFVIGLKGKSPNMDIVFAQAAGNERCRLTQIINDLKSDPKYKRVFEENYILVSDYSFYANTSTAYGDFCFIKEHPYYEENGGTTSYATPQALCYINQVMKGTIGEDGKNIKAEQALKAVKAAIRQNSKGELDLDEALEMARNMYGGGYVDLGLPSGTLWALRNVQANSPEQSGYYLAWAETQEKSYYDWDTYRYWNSSTYSVTKYNDIDGLTTLQQNDDAATYNLGNGQRMPTYDDWNELMTHCTQTYTTLDGVKGIKFKASNGNSIFLPAAGFRHEGGIFNYGQYDGYGFYWTSSRSENNPNNAWYVRFNESETPVLRDFLRLFGLSIRPVRSPN